MNLFGNYTLHIRDFFLISIFSISIMSCGGGGGGVTAGISGTGIVFGTITDFGSIFVNGVEYEIEGASSDVDGQSATITNNGDLKLGMVVRLEGVTDNGDGTGVATSVTYEDSIEGPVTTVPATPASGDTNLKEFEIMGQMVIINATTTYFEAVSFDSIAQEDVVEVSGFIDQDGTIIATRIEKTDDLGTGADVSVEIHGQITEVLGPNTMRVDNLEVRTTNETETEDYSGAVVGLFVEVEGLYQPDQGTGEYIIATKVEGEDDDRDAFSSSEGDFSLQGVITDFVDDSDFKVNGIQVDASALSLSIILENGLQVEVNGELTGGVLIADEVELRSGEASFTARITSVDNIASNSITIGYPNVTGDITLNFDSQSQLQDETEQFDSLSLSDLMVDMTIKVEVKSDESDWLVTSLKLVDDTEELEIEGVVTSKSLANLTLTINGLVLTMDPLAEYDTDVIVDATAQQFFDAITVDTTRVELENKENIEIGLFDSAEFD